MYCPKCGAQNSDQANFCRVCGEKLANDTHNHADDLSGSPQTGTPPKRRRTLALAAAALALIILAAVLAAMFLLKKPETASPAADTSQSVSQPVETTAPQAPESETAAEETPEEVLELPAVSALDDGNLFGNTHCYARMVSDGKTCYFRNPLDNERTYRIAEGSMEASPFGEFYMKDMHLSDGYIYYCRTGKGDVSGTEPDRNIYRIKTDGTENQKLTDISYGGGEAWLSFDTIVDGTCYFTYSDGTTSGYHIAAAATDGSGYQDLHFIEPSSCLGAPTLNVLDGKIYYKAADGLNCLDIASGANSLQIPGFKCEEYIIYGGEIYYSVNANQGETVAKIRKMNLDGTGAKALFIPPATDSWVQYIRLNIYNGKLYLIGLSEDSQTESKGIVYSCEPDGSNARPLIERATWFNIVNGRLYYHFSDKDSVEATRNEPFYSVAITDLEQASSAADLQPRPFFDTDAFNLGWVQAGEDWYYYDENHQMAKSRWATIDGKNYCFGEDGTLYVNTTTPDGTTVGPDGAAVSGPGATS